MKPAGASAEGFSARPAESEHPETEINHSQGATKVTKQPSIQKRKRSGCVEYSR
ncbi:hypothetical protein [Fictibacillus sp. KU28468]|uniref:hypothetical protein n=1 Tax=Fictibacillus sp. KU28468 TaxID=2991053 RepID=UPI00223CB3C4|nr:hypothetical protein [Fictibacillus sp. KU28468]UZJ79092.1 hypothetical protein OKX00_00965 [Fictibacillus sp. KU28468]